MDTPRGESQGRHSGTARRAPWLKLEMEEESQASGWARCVWGGAQGGPHWRVGLQKGVMLRLTKVSLHDGVVGGLGHEL